MRTVLLVDDNEMLRTLAAKNLELDIPQLRAVGTSTCEEARKLLAELEPDVVVLDHVLADGTGLDLMAEVTPLRSETAFVVISADTGPALRRRALATGAFAVLAKPCDTEVLVDVVERALQQRHPGRQLADEQPEEGPALPAEIAVEVVERIHHRAVNRLTALVAGLRALEADLHQATVQDSPVRRVVDGYLDGLLRAASDLSKILQELHAETEPDR